MRRERGFTLLEVLIAITVLGLSVAGLVAMHSTMTRENRAASILGEASAAGQATLEELRTRSLSELTADFGPLPISAALPPVTRESGIPLSRTVEVQQVAAATDLYRLRVVVSWRARDLSDHDVAYELMIHREAAP